MSYKSAANDMARGGQRAARAKELCAAVRSPAVRGWVGTIYKLSSNSDGKGVLEVQISQHVWLTTWSNAFSDIGDHTLIDPASAVFAQASQMKPRHYRTPTGVDTESSASIVAGMCRGATGGGTIKCRKFTRLVDIAKTMSVISTTLRGLYCALTWAPIRDSLVTDPRNAPSQGRSRKYSSWVWIAGCALLAYHTGTACAQSPPATEQGVIGSGTASYYGQAHQGRRTASGARFDQKALTAAHPWLPFGTKVRVTLLGTSRSVVVEITDRLYSNRRVVDLSLAAARALGMVGRGVAMVALTPG